MTTSGCEQEAKRGGKEVVQIHIWLEPGETWYNRHQPTTKFKILQLSTHLAATPFVTQSSIDIVCFVVVLPPSRSQAVTKARKELGIKGFCAVNGVHASTSLWCTRAPPLEVGVPTDQEVARCSGVDSACGVGRSGVTGSECSACSCEGGADSGMIEQGMMRETIAADGAAWQSQRETSSMTRMGHYLHFKEAVAALMWTEAEGFTQQQMDGESWNQYLRQKLPMMDFLFRAMELEQSQLWEQGDLKVENTRRERYLFQLVMMQVSQEVQIRYFLAQHGFDFDMRSGQMDLAESEVINEDADGQGLSSHAPGSTEDVSWDMDGQGSNGIKGRSFYKEFAKRKAQRSEDGLDSLDSRGLASMHRGGMNRFHVLGEEVEEEPEEASEGADDGASVSYGSVNEGISDITENELETSFQSTGSGGRSFYAEYFAQKATCRGGAGGANATKNKKLTEAIGALAEVVRNFEATPDEPESIDQVIHMIGQVATEWQNKTPTRNEMKKQLLKFHQILEKDAHQMANPRASRDEAVGKGPQQSFYEGFVQRFQKETENDNANKWQTKGSKGKSKGKGGKEKGKGKGQSGSPLPKFDIMKILPTKALTTWQVLGRELEEAKEPSGTAVIMDSVEKMCEYQALAKAHGLTSNITMIAKFADDDLTGLSNPVKLWLPYLSNLALVQAVVATTSGEKTTLTGIEPIKKDGKGADDHGKMIALRMVLDLKLVKEKKLREHYKEQPHTSLHHALGKCTFKEIKTSGWTIGDELITGYGYVHPDNVEEVLRLSGKAGLFSSRLRQDIQELPPVSWIKKLDGETDAQYHDRAMEKADEGKVALTRRNGGGAYLGLLKEDDETRNRAWQISGIPTTWGPTSVRNWLESNDWYVETMPKPPNGKFKTWAVQGYVKSEPLKKHFAYQIKCGTKDCNITVYRWQKQRKPKAEDKENEKQIRGSRWWSADMSDPIEDTNEVSPTLRYTPEVGATVMDVDEDGKGGDSQAGAGKRLPDSSKNESPQKKKKTKTTAKLASPEVTLQGGSQGPIGSILLNLGGGGDCGWRALAWSFATANKTTSEKAVDTIETLSTTLRIKTVNFLKVNCSRWKDAWCPDDKATALTEDGEPARDYETFLSVLDRPRRWMCGLGLTAAALQMKCNIIIWQFDGKACDTHDQSKWRRAAIIKGCRGPDKGKSPIVALVLHRGHYFALRYPPLRKAWPREWLVSPEEAEQNIPVTQEVEEAAELSAVCRGGGNGDDCAMTPSKTKMEDVEHMLRSFSSRGSSSKTDVAEVERMLRTCSSIASEKKSSTTKVIKHVLKGPTTWTCPICEEKLDLHRWKRPHNVITDHLSRRHTAIYDNAVAENKRINRRGAGMGMAGLVRHVTFQTMDKSKWQDEAEFVCPYCEQVLPWLGGKRSQKHGRGYLLRLSKKHHMQFDCKFRHEKKGVTMRQYHFDSLAKFGQRFSWCNTQWYMKSKFIEKAKERGHNPVVFVFPKRVTARRSLHQMVCTLCRKGLSSGDAGNVQCKGIGSRRAFNPGRVFWAQVTLNRKKKEAMDKLGMTAAEINKAYEAVSVFRAFPSKRRLREEAKKKNQKL